MESAAHMFSSRNRITDLLKRFFRRQPNSSAPSDRCQRNYDRFPIEFRLEAAFLDENGQEQTDRAELHDISASGALFKTQLYRQYSPGQRVRVTVFLAGTDDVKANLHTEATVVRIHSLEQDPEHTGVAVKFDKSFEFQRVNSHNWR